MVRPNLRFSEWTAVRGTRRSLDLTTPNAPRHEMGDFGAHPARIKGKFLRSAEPNLFRGRFKP
jgi:hypothetical protein